MRTLGTGATQSAAGNHSHTGLTDSGWVNFTPIGGDSPFGSAVGTVTTARVRKVGKMVHVQIQKASGSAVDFTGGNGNFGNILVMGIGSVPTIYRPDTNPVNGSARMLDSSASVYLRSDGAIVWAGGQPRNYPSGSQMFADFTFFTTA